MMCGLRRSLIYLCAAALTLGTAAQALASTIPMLYNDRHVNAKPIVLVNGRVLAGFAQNGTLLVPLREMFEDMGAMVTWDGAQKTMHVTKAGSAIVLTVGRPSIAVNGDRRPLDVPPTIAGGVVVAPVRVISEALGAYVAWLPAKQTVAIRYTPVVPPSPTPEPVPTPTPEPPPPATPPPTPTPSPTPAPTPKPGAYLGYLSADYSVAGKEYNEFSPGNNVRGSGRVEGMFEFPSLQQHFLVGGDVYKNSVFHDQGISTAQAANNALAAGLPVTGPNGAPAIPCSPAGTAGDQGCVTVIGGGGQTFVPGFNVNEITYEAKFGVRILQPRTYLTFGYTSRANNYGYPTIGGFGAGLVKFPDLNNVFSLRGQIMWYGYIHGNFSDPAGQSYTIGYRQLTYDAGITFAPHRSPVFLQGGVRGESDSGRGATPSNRTYTALYAGLGIKLNPPIQPDVLAGSGLP